MSAPVKIAKISVSIPDSNYSPEGLKIMVAVGSVPTASVSLVRNAKKKVQSPLAQDVLDEIGARQKIRLAGRDAPDITINADDGIGHTLTFKGFMTAPVIEVSKTSTSDQFTVLGLDGALDGLDMSIYSAGWQAERAEDSAGGAVELEPCPAATDGKVTELIAAITGVLFLNFDAALSREQSEDMQKLMTQQHELNAGLPFPLWIDILRNSDVVYDSWAKAVAEVNSLAAMLSERIMNMLTQKTSGFWGTVNTLLASFQMYYVPSTEGSGKLVRADKKVGDATKTLEVSANSISVSDGSHKLMQPGGVVMVGPGAEAERTETQGGPIAVAAQYPDPLIKGYIHREPPPMWLVNPNGSPVLGSELDKAREGDLGLGLRSFAARRDKATIYKAKVNTQSSLVMTELCKVMFEELQLAHSTAVITIPLNFSMQVGIRYTINVKGGGGTFTAFLNALVHSVDLRAGKELNSFTQLSFTHVKY